MSSVPSLSDLGQQVPCKLKETIHHTTAPDFEVHIMFLINIALTKPDPRQEC